MRWAAGAPRRAACRSMHRAACRTAARSTASPVCGRHCCAAPRFFVGTVTEKLLTYALGRGVEDDDAPAVRGIVREARGNDYRFSSLVLGIVNSTPFQMRRSQ